MSDVVIDAIYDELATVPPERGAALLGFGDLVHLLIADSKGRYSPASWDISAELSQVVGDIENAGYGTLMGTVHSHPNGIPDPSGTDLRTTSIAMDMNPHLDALFIAVVTVGAARELDIPVGSTHRMSMHEMRRHDPSGKSGYRVDRIKAVTSPLGQSLKAANLLLSCSTTVDEWNQTRKRKKADFSPILTVDGREKLLVPLPSTQPRALLFDSLFPLIGPLCVSVGGNSVGSHAHLGRLPSPWDPVAPPDVQVGRLSRRTVGAAVDGSFARVTQLVGALSNRSAVVVGLGSVGSRMAEDLTRAGLGSLVLVDPDMVEAPNLSRTVYRVDDLGMSKVDALEERLLSINPALRVQKNGQTIGEIEWPEVLQGTHLVVAATDDMQEQALLSHHAYWNNVPMISCALYRRAAAGEVVLSFPQVGSACWSCAVGVATDATSLRPPSDYGLTSRLVSESALGPSINLVASVASQMAIGALAGPHTLAGMPVGSLLGQGRTLGLISTSPEWEFFPSIFPSMKHQFEPQSVWVAVERDPKCPVCGDDRRPPIGSDAGHEIAEALALLIEEERGDSMIGSLNEASDADAAPVGRESPSEPSTEADVALPPTLAPLD